VPLAPLTSFRIGGPARYLVTARGVDDMDRAIRIAEAERLPLKILGGGSNILVADEGVEAVVLRLDPAGAFGRADIDGNVLRAGGAAKTGKLIALAEREGLSGLEPLAGIPGTIAGAIRMNAGGRGGTVGPLVRCVRALDLEAGGGLIELGPDEMEFSYRTSSLTGMIILGVELELQIADPKKVGEATREWLRRRRATQPGGEHSAGCVFRNPSDAAAGELIDGLGLKGVTAGGASISEVHANYIVASGGAKASDVRELIELVRERALRERGVALELEIEIWE